MFETIRFTTKHFAVFATVEFVVDNMAVWTLAEVNKGMIHIATRNADDMVLMRGNKTLTYYIIRKKDLITVTNGKTFEYATVYHVEVVDMVELETDKCPECGHKAEFQRWYKYSGERVYK
jgi:hypothetical protein